MYTNKELIKAERLTITVLQTFLRIIKYIYLNFFKNTYKYIYFDVSPSQKSHFVQV